MFLGARMTARVRRPMVSAAEEHGDSGESSDEDEMGSDSEASEDSEEDESSPEDMTREGGQGWSNNSVEDIEMAEPEDDSEEGMEDVWID